MYVCMFNYVWIYECVIKLYNFRLSLSPWPSLALSSFTSLSRILTFCFPHLIWMKIMDHAKQAVINLGKIFSLYYTPLSKKCDYLFMWQKDNPSGCHKAWNRLIKSAERENSGVSIQISRKNGHSIGEW